MYEVIVLGESFLTKVHQWINPFTVTWFNGHTAIMLLSIQKFLKVLRALSTLFQVLAAYAAWTRAGVEAPPRILPNLGPARHAVYL
jgi:hypothetical protein